MQPSKVGLATLASLVTAVVLSVVLALIDVNHQVSLYGFAVWFIIPIGAIGCGLVGAGGFWLAARALHLRPSGPARALPLLSAFVTFLLTNYLTYRWVELPNGKSLTAVMGFVEYLRSVSTESGYTIGDDATIDRLGSLGYAVTALQVVGFAAGGFIVASSLRSLPWCERSGRFMRRGERANRFMADSPEYPTVANAAFGAMTNDDIVGVRAILDDPGESTVKARQRRHQLALVEHVCDDCGLRRLTLSAHVLRGNNWQQVQSVSRELVDGASRPPAMAAAAPPMPPATQSPIS